MELLDNLALGLSHGLMLLAAWRLLSRPDLDDPAAPPPVPSEPTKKRPWTMRDAADA